MLQRVDFGNIQSIRAFFLALGRDSATLPRLVGSVVDSRRGGSPVERVFRDDLKPDSREQPGT